MSRHRAEVMLMIPCATWLHSWMRPRAKEEITTAAYPAAFALSRLRARAAELRVPWEEAGDAEHDQLRPEPRRERYSMADMICSDEYPPPIFIICLIAWRVRTW